MTGREGPLPPAPRRDDAHPRGPAAGGEARAEHELVSLSRLRSWAVFFATELAPAGRAQSVVGPCPLLAWSSGTAHTSRLGQSRRRTQSSRAARPHASRTLALGRSSVCASARTPLFSCWVFGADLASSHSCPCLPAPLSGFHASFDPAAAAFSPHSHLHSSTVAAHAALSTTPASSFSSIGPQETASPTTSATAVYAAQTTPAFSASGASPSPSSHYSSLPDTPPSSDGISNKRIRRSSTPHSASINPYALSQAASSCGGSPGPEALQEIDTAAAALSGPFAPAAATKQLTGKGKKRKQLPTTAEFQHPDTSGLSKKEARLVKNRAAAFLSRQRCVVLSHSCLLLSLGVKPPTDQPAPPPPPHSFQEARAV